MKQAISLSLLLFFHLALPSFATVPTIEWDASTLRLIEKDADYARMVRLADGSIACAYNQSGKMWIRHSTDEGKTWTDAIAVAEERDCWLTNAELLLLKDGSLLYFWNERPLAALRSQRSKSPTTALTRPFLI